MSSSRKSLHPSSAHSGHWARGGGSDKKNSPGGYGYFLCASQETLEEDVIEVFQLANINLNILPAVHLHQPVQLTVLSLFHLNSCW